MSNLETNMSSAQEIQLSTIEEKSSEKLRAFRKKVGHIAVKSTGYAYVGFMAHDSITDVFPAAPPSASIGVSLLATTAFFVGGNKISSILKERKARKSEKTTSETQPISTEINDSDTPVV